LVEQNVSPALVAHTERLKKYCVDETALVLYNAAKLINQRKKVRNLISLPSTVGAGYAVKIFWVKLIRFGQN